jgi:effector-binding domain-containing protein
MKILKIIAILIGILVLVAIFLGLTGPKSYDVHRSAVVSGSPDQVWPYVSSLKNMALWSPWAEKDTAMVVEYTGTDGTVGSMSSWSGNKKVGKGSQTISVLEPNSYMESQLKFLEPWSGEATAYTRLSDTTGGTLVVWGLKGENGFMSRIFASFMDMDKMMSPDFERGLTKLTELMASAPKMQSSPLVVEPGQFAGGRYLGIRSNISMDQMETFYGTNLGKVFEALQKAGIQPAGMPCGLYFTWDMEKNTTDMAAAVSFKGDMKKVPEGMVVLDVPAAKSLTINYMGGYSGLGNAHNTMDVYIKENKLEHFAPVIEEYLTDPGAEPDSTKWLTKIVYLVK